MSRILSGTGSPEGVITADVATLFLRTDGSTSSTLYVKETGVGNTGWTAVGLVSGAVSLAMIQDITSDRLLGRDTASSGDVEELTVGGGLEFTGSGGIQRSALTGDVTASAGSGSTTIADDAVTNAKLANVDTATFKGRTTAGTGSPEDMTATQATALLDVVSTTAKGLVPQPDGTTTKFLRADATFARPKAKLFLTYGVATVTAGTTGRYLNPVGHSTTPAGASPFFYGLPVAGNLIEVHYRAGTAHSTNTIEIRPRISGVETDINFDVAAADTTESLTLGTPLAVSIGDTIACRVDHNGATSLANVCVTFVIEYDL